MVVSSSRLQRNQAYEFWVELTVPESETNENIGMFMVQMQLENSNHEILAKCSRPAAVKYTSSMLRTMNTIVYSAPLILGWSRQTQYIQLRCFDGFIESSNHPVRFVKIKLSHPDFQIYSSTLRIHALLSGVRYIMYHWWLAGAVVGISQLMAGQIIFILLLWLYFRGTTIAAQEPAWANNNRNFASSHSYEGNNMQSIRETTQFSPNADSAAEDEYGDEKEEVKHDEAKDVEALEGDTTGEGLRRRVAAKKAVNVSPPGAI
jgi:hypothetical protein